MIFFRGSPSRLHRELSSWANASSMACDWRVSVIFPDFEGFIRSLNAHRVRYLIVGGYAVGFHARPRATKDIDILVDRTEANARRTRAAIIAFIGGEAPNITETKLMSPRALIVLGVDPIRIDILTSIDGWLRSLLPGRGRWLDRRPR